MRDLYVVWANHEAYRGQFNASFKSILMGLNEQVPTVFTEQVLEKYECRIRNPTQPPPFFEIPTSAYLGAAFTFFTFPIRVERDEEVTTNDNPVYKPIFNFMFEDKWQYDSTDFGGWFDGTYYTSAITAFLGHALWGAALGFAIDVSGILLSDDRETFCVTMVLSTVLLARDYELSTMVDKGVAPPAGGMTSMRDRDQWDRLVDDLEGLYTGGTFFGTRWTAWKDILMQAIHDTPAGIKKPVKFPVTLGHGNRLLTSTFIKEIPWVAITRHDIQFLSLDLPHIAIRQRASSLSMGSFMVDLSSSLWRSKPP